MSAVEQTFIEIETGRPISQIDWVAIRALAKLVHASDLDDQRELEGDNGEPDKPEPTDRVYSIL